MTLFLLLRLRAHWVLVGAAFLVVLLTTTVLATLALFSGAVGDAALRQTLGGRAAASASLVISAKVPPGGEEAARQAVLRGAEDTFDGLPVTVRRLEQSGSYALPAGSRAPSAQPEEPDLTHFAALDRSRIRLVSGELPGPGLSGAGPGPVPVAVPQAAAERLDMRTGARLTLVDRLDGQRLDVRVTGVYRPLDTTDPYWLADQLAGRGVRTLSFTTYGPLLADPSVLSSGRTSAGPTGWVARADHRALTTERLGALRDAAARGLAGLREDPALGGGQQVTTALPAVLDQFSRSLLVARSTLLVFAVQLVLVAAGALLLVGRLLGAERAAQTDLLRARGGSRRRITALAWAEALVLVVPAAACAPLLAGPLARLLEEHSALGRLGLRLDGTVTPALWLVCGLVALGCAAAIVPGVGTGRRGRSKALPAFLRAGADIGLLAVAAVAYWQLSRQASTAGGGVLGTDADGRLGIDPVLAAAPALALLAGTVLVLRLVPVAARLGERRAARGRSLSAALTAWQFGRRPRQGAGPALLLVLAVALGVLAVGQSSSWDRSQRDQADFLAGASVRVLAYGAAAPGDADRYASLPGVRAAAPAHRASLPLPDGRTATVLALDTARADQRLMLRQDLARKDADALLAAVRPKSAGVRAGLVLPTRTSSLTLRVRLEDGRTGAAPREFEPALTVEVEDAYGVTHRLPAGTLADDAASHDVVVRLDETAGGGRVTPWGPLTVTGLRLSGRVPPGSDPDLRLAVERVRARSDGAATLRAVGVPDGLRWQGTATAAVDGATGAPATLRPSATAERPLSVAHRVASTVDPDAPDPPAETVTLRLWAQRPAPPGQVAGTATDDFLRAVGARRGQTLDVTVAGTDVRVRIVDTARQLPTTGAEAGAVVRGGTGPAPDDATPDNAAADARATDGGALLLDLRAVNEVLARSADAPLAPTEWWLSTDPGEAGPVAAALRERPDTDPADVLVRDEIATALLDDPLGAAPRAAPPAAVAAAAVLAAVGFAVGVLASLRERRAEHAVLHALGASRSTLARQTAVEQSVLIAVALVAGTVLGTALTRAVVPLTVLTARGTRPVPDVLAALPPHQVALLLAGIAWLPLTAVAVLAPRRTRTAELLRHQGDS
ncbi:ABC transporter permease [Streptomyces poonensis]|uniref:ABC3 transporter permease C-terminal domain-containing protein n=1 Tax=Streptomyces poonensis TaxID=68255 RepID=A0A918PBN7_9ACTN|nr:ABC transporter permease [Streptomyces poonensis]GGY97141.1 hypothetical protein GCM10010365_14460 [Streptomyces poonensis]